MLKHRVASIHGVEPAKTAGSALRMIG
jgi:hypothetical protein